MLARVHAHVQWPILGEAEATLLLIQLHAADPKVQHNRIHASRHAGRGQPSYQGCVAKTGSPACHHAILATDQRRWHHDQNYTAGAPARINAAVAARTQSTIDNNVFWRC